MRTTCKNIFTHVRKLSAHAQNTNAQICKCAKNRRAQNAQICSANIFPNAEIAICKCTNLHCAQFSVLQVFRFVCENFYVMMKILHNKIFKLIIKIKIFVKKIILL